MSEVYICTVVKSEGHQACVKYKKLVTDFLPVVTHRAGSTVISSPLSVGEQVMVIANDADIANGVIIASIHQNKSAAENTDGFKFKTEHAVFEVKQDQVITAVGATIITATASNVTVVTEDAKVKAKNKITLDAPITLATGQLQCGSLAGISGELLPIDSTLTGQIKVEGDVIVNGISSFKHKHPHPQGQTGVPQ